MHGFKKLRVQIITKYHRASKRRASSIRHFISSGISRRRRNALFLSLWCEKEWAHLSLYAFLFVVILPRVGWPQKTVEIISLSLYYLKFSGLEFRLICAANIRWHSLEDLQGKMWNRWHDVHLTVLFSTVLFIITSIQLWNNILAQLRNWHSLPLSKFLISSHNFSWENGLESLLQMHL